MSDNKTKKYYSINLTEGRVWIIFILCLLFIVLVTFVVVIIMNINSNKNDSNDSFFSNSSNSSSQSSFVENNSSSLNNQSSSSSSLDIINPDNQKPDIITKDDKIVENKINENDVVILDDSEIVYSSKYKDKDEKNINQNKQSYSSKSQSSVKTNNSKEIKKRYAVQIGSYENKKLAEDISIYYKMTGYPTYIEEKSDKGKVYYRLRVGPFKEKIKAEEYLATLKTSKYGQKSMLWEFYL